MTQIQQEKEISQQYRNSHIHFKYNLVNSIKQQQKCHSIIFNQILCILIFTCYQNLKIFQFKQGNIKLISFINGNLYNNNNCLLFINLQNQFISSNSNGQIRFWSLNLLNNNKRSQFLNNNQEINCMLKNRQENLLIKGQVYKQPFGKGIINGNCQNPLKLMKKYMPVEDLNINWLLRKLLMIGYLPNHFIYQQEDLEYFFIKITNFAFQPWCRNALQIYTIDEKNEISLIEEVKIKNEQMKTCALYSPLQFFQNKSNLLNKNQNCLLLIILKENGELINQQTIQLIFLMFMGNYQMMDIIQQVGREIQKKFKFGNTHNFDQ
ncbi:unnamed protein product [Paramecium pentaurelia]|uniref:Uncharacterized protein n=1 Tax=Paramecium pentaurelia TaxID=43138 RepID=A0A8S1U175_9CILI|nr:unnamed protein product [Paramecium pentaurelia]